MYQLMLAVPFPCLSVLNVQKEKSRFCFTSLNNLILKLLYTVHSSAAVFDVQGHLQGLTLPEV